MLCRCCYAIELTSNSDHCKQGTWECAMAHSAANKVGQLTRATARAYRASTAVISGTAFFTVSSRPARVIGDMGQAPQAPSHSS